MGSTPTTCSHRDSIITRKTNREGGDGTGVFRWKERPYLEFGSSCSEGPDVGCVAVWDVVWVLYGLREGSGGWFPGVYPQWNQDE